MGDGAGAGIGGLAQVALTARDVDAAAAFYGDVLGLKPLFRPPGMAFFQAGEVRLMVAAPEGLGEDGGTVLYYRVADLDGAHARLAARGVAFETPPHVVHRDASMVLRMAFLRDPAGNLLALMEERSPVA